MTPEDYHWGGRIAPFLDRGRRLGEAVETAGWRLLAEQREEVLCRQGKELVKLRKQIVKLKKKTKKLEQLLDLFGEV